jgi:[acyl-carrier-protein] S-malonyltransferase
VYELLVDQVDHSVRWKQSVGAMIEAGYTSGVEFGPGKVLQGLAKRIVGSYPGKEFPTTGLSDRAGLDALKTFIA